MALARFERPLQDEDGNIVTVATVTVRRMDTNALGVLYDDRNAATPKINPFTLAPGDNGIIAFHVIGGAYKITAVSASGTVEWTYVPIGTAQEQDTNDFANAGWITQFETSTSSPPSDTCVRANNADLSLATKLYIDVTTMGGTSMATILDDLDPGAKTVNNTIRLTDLAVGADASWQVTAVTDHTTWKELDITGHSGATSFSAGTLLALQREMSGADGFGTTPNELVVTTAGPFTITNETALILNKAAPSATTINLPAVASRGGLALTITDWGGNAGDITITPNGAEKIQGLAASMTLVSGGQGPGIAASVTLKPNSSLSGWYI